MMYMAALHADACVIEKILLQARVMCLLLSMRRYTQSCRARRSHCTIPWAWCGRQFRARPARPTLGTASDSMSLERDCSDQLLETWMLLEYCDQGNLESAARESRFKNDFVSALATAPVPERQIARLRGTFPPGLCQVLPIERLKTVCRKTASAS